jgi:crossover junction endodeoxyribonuclease RusA
VTRTRTDPELPSVTFTIPGRPQSKQRPRLGAGGRVYTPRPTRKYEQTVAACYLVAAGGRRRSSYTGPVELRITCTFADHRRRDLDNVVKAIADGLNGIAYADDCQVTAIRAARHHGECECAVVEVVYP